ncbi:MAG: hypothetical protein HQ580_15910 [Planctomycetes bacterium]|nr:hypothetical protein [Planctomycetota bacterium]
MDKNITLTLPSLMVGQILDALYMRLETWEYTEEYLNTGHVHEPYLIEECSNAYEARQIADYYKEIIKSIEKQADIPTRVRT